MTIGDCIRDADWTRGTMKDLVYALQTTTQNDPDIIRGIHEDILSVDNEIASIIDRLGDSEHDNSQKPQGHS